MSLDTGNEYVERDCGINDGGALSELVFMLYLVTYGFAPARLGFRSAIGYPAPHRWCLTTANSR